MPIILSISLWLAACSAFAATLYDASLGSLPDQQGWLEFSNGSPSISHTGSATRLDTTSNSDIQSGYFSEHPLLGAPEHPLMPTLDRDLGFSIDFSLQVLAENHLDRDINNDGLLDRAGFSLIAIAEDRFGIEIAFFTDRIWAYDQVDIGGNLEFVQAEHVLIETTQATQYQLRGNSSGYSLFVNDTNILSGAWRQYDESVLFPYDNPSSIFFGDDTTSASSDVLIGDITVTVGPIPTRVPIPLPFPALLLGAALVGLRFRQLR